MIRAFLSLPMSGRADEEVRKQIEEMKELTVKSHIFGDEEIEFIHNFDCTPTTIYGLENQCEVTPPLMYLGEAIKRMSYCNAVILGKGWSKARGCIMEREVAKHYDIPIYRCTIIDQMMKHDQ